MYRQIKFSPGTGYAEANFAVRGSVGRVQFGLNVRLPDNNFTATVFSGMTADMLEVFLCTGTKAAKRGEHNWAEKGVALIVLSNSRGSDAAAPLARRVLRTASGPARTPDLEIRA